MTEFTHLKPKSQKDIQKALKGKRQYLVVKDYYPLIHKRDGTYGPVSGSPVLEKGDILVKLKANDSCFISINNAVVGLYEYTLKEYFDCFKLIHK